VGCRRSIRTGWRQRTWYSHKRVAPRYDRHPHPRRAWAQTKEFFRLQIPREKLRKPEEMASAALFLTSRDFSFINGVSFSSTMEQSKSKPATTRNLKDTLLCSLPLFLYSKDQVDRGLAVITPQAAFDFFPNDPYKFHAVSNLLAYGNGICA
jgi:hypothetical protein